MDHFRYTSILFDFDGTLTHSLPVWLKAYQTAMRSFGIHMSDDEVMKECFYRPWQEIIDQFKLPSQEAFGAKVLRGVEDCFEEAELFDGVMCVLDECKSRGLKLAIVTSSTKRVVEKYLAENSLKNHFLSVVTADDIINFKPHPEPVLMALGHLESLAQDTLMIGDSYVDLVAGHAAGTDRALFFPDEHHYFYNLEELSKHEPHFTFHNYSELLHRMSAIAQS